MPPVLIYTDTQQTVFDKGALTAQVALYQNIYNAFSAIDIPVTLSEIRTLLDLTNRPHSGSADLVKEFAIDKLLDAAAPYELNGIMLQRDKVRDMIVPPDTTAVRSIITNAVNIPLGYGSTPAQLDLLTLTGNLVAKAANSDSIIEEQNKSYTKSDASATLANSLITVCNALNALDPIYKKDVSDTMSSYVSRGFLPRSVFKLQVKTAIPGIALIDSTFVPSVDYIRHFEG